MLSFERRRGFSRGIEALDEFGGWGDSIEGFDEDYRYRCFSSRVPASRSTGEGLVVMGEGAGYATTRLLVQKVVETGYWSHKEKGEGGENGCYLDEVNGIAIDDEAVNNASRNGIGGTYYESILSGMLEGDGLGCISFGSTGFLKSAEPRSVSWGQ